MDYAPVPDDPKEGSDAPCCPGGPWHRRNPKELDDVSTINQSPWRPTLQYACLLIALCLVIPIVVQLALSLGLATPELLANKGNGTDTSQVRIEPEWFKPWWSWWLPPLLTAGFLLFLLFPADMNKWQRAIMGFADETVELLQRPWRAGVPPSAASPRSASTASFATGTGKETHTTTPCRTCVVFFCFAIMGGVVPCFAWYGPLTWWSDAAAQYRVCHHWCSKEVLTSGNTSGKAVKVCAKHMSIHQENYPRSLFAGTEGDDEARCPSSRICEEILQAQTSKFTDHMLYKGHTFLAFESNVRQHYAISFVDIFGAALELGLFILVFCARAALREQAWTLLRLKVQYIKDHMVKVHYSRDDQSVKIDVGRWYRFFTQLKLEMNRTDSWPLKVLTKAKEANSERELNNIFEEFTNENLNNISDESENCTFSCASIRFTLLAFFWAVLDALIPYLSRRLFHKGHDCILNPDAERDFGIISGLSIIATFLGAFSSFFLLSSAYVRNMSQISAVIAFDCLFRFPLEHPQTAVLVQGSQSLEKYLELHSDNLQEGQSSGGLTSTAGSQPLRAAGSADGPHDGRYFAHFTTLQEMNEDLTNFDYYFLGRQYLQLDKVDERNCLEIAMVVALLSLIPRFIIVLCNFQWETGNKKFLQPVNVAFMWRLGFVFFMSILSLLETMNLNEHFGTHGKKLQSLLNYNAYCASLPSNTGERKKEEATGNAGEERRKEEATGSSAGEERKKEEPTGSNAGEERRNEEATGSSAGEEREKEKVKEENKAANLIGALIALMDSHDLPSTLFGLKVRWHMLAGFVGVWSLSVPQLFFFFSELVEYLAEKV